MWQVGWIACHPCQVCALDAEMACRLDQGRGHAGKQGTCSWLCCDACRRAASAAAMASSITPALAAAARCAAASTSFTCGQG